MRSLFLVVISIGSGCGQGTPIDQFCRRAQDCNLLSTSVDECIDSLDRSRAELTSADQGELDLSLQDCLDHPSCDGFHTCIQNLGM